MSPPLADIEGKSQGAEQRLLDLEGTFAGMRGNLGVTAKPVGKPPFPLAKAEVGSC